MTIEEFDRTKFTVRMTVIYLNNRYNIIAVNFQEKLLGLADKDYEPNDITWARCESVMLEKTDSLFELMNSQPKD